MITRKSKGDKNNPADADIVFEALPERPRPRFPRPADGVRFLTLDQAAAKYNVPRQTLLNEWVSTFASIDLSANPKPPTPAAPVRVAIPAKLYGALRKAWPKRVGQTTRSFILAWLGLATSEEMSKAVSFAISDETVRAAMEKDEERTVHRLQRRVRRQAARIRDLSKAKNAGRGNG